MNIKNSPAMFSLVYVSRCSPAFLAADEDQRRKALIAVQSAEKARTRQAGINGVLIVAEGFFIGWMEGDETAVTARATALAGSFFHTGIQIIFTGTAQARLDQWTMVLAARTDAKFSLAKQIAVLQSGKRPKTRGSIPAAMLRSIIEPEPLRRKLDLTRIGLVGQTGVWSSALVAHLSDAWGVPVLHTRINGGLGFGREGIIDYLNAEHPVFGHIRLVNLAGDVPSMMWMRAIEEKMSACVLFYSINELQAATAFTDLASSHLQAYSRFTPLLCLFGRSAASQMEPVQDLFAAQAREISVDRLSLADSAAVWRAIEKTLATRQSNPSVDAGWAPSSLLLNTAAVTRVEAPLLEFRLSEKAAPVIGSKQLAARSEPLAATHTDQPAASSSGQKVPAATAAPAPASLSLAGQQLLASLLEIDAVVAVGVQCGQNGPAAVLIGHEPGLTPADAQARELAFRTGLSHETDQHATLLPLHQAEGKRNQKMLTRWRNRFCLSFDIRGPELVIVLIEMAAGYNNESLVRAAVRACVNGLREPVFERVPGA